MRQIEVLDKDFKRLAFISNELENGINYSNDQLKTSIEGGIYTLDLTIPKTTGLTQNIKEGHYITFFNRQDLRVLLTIMDITETGDELDIYCEDTSLNLINKVVTSQGEPLQSQGIDHYINELLTNTGWSIGINESVISLQLAYTGTETLLSRLRKIVKDFEVEFYFEVEMDGPTNPSFLVHIVKQRVEGVEGFRVSTDDLLDGITRKINIDNIATKVIVIGKEVATTIGTGDAETVTVVTDAVSNTQLPASKYDSSKSAGATRLSTAGWGLAEVNRFKMDQADPPHVTGDYIDTFLRSFYSDSPLVGHGKYIKEASDYWGISVGAAMGIWAKESTFGRNACGGRYNFGCIMWTEGSPFNKKWANDRYWIDPPTVESAINAWFKLVRWSYTEAGSPFYSTNYEQFLNFYSPGFENNQATFKNLMWSVLKSFGYDTSDTTKKKNYSKSSDNPLNVNIGNKTVTTTTPSEATIYQTMLDKMIQWFQDRKGKVTYSMTNRGGPNSYDCSSAVYASLIYAGFKPTGTWLGSTVTLWGEVGTLIKEIPRSEARKGDLFLGGPRGAASAGASGHTGVFIDNQTIIHCNYNDNGITQTQASGRTGSPVACFRLIDKTNGATVSGSTSGHAPGGDSSNSGSAKLEEAIGYCLAGVGVTPYAWGGTTTNGWDCSGMIYNAYRKAGIEINHRCTTSTMANGQYPFKKISRSELKRGDLILYYNGPTHVGVYLGNDQLVHAATPALGTIRQNAWSMPVYGYVRVQGV